MTGDSTGLPLPSERKPSEGRKAIAASAGKAAPDTTPQGPERAHRTDLRVSVQRESPLDRTRANQESLRPREQAAASAAVVSELIPSCPLLCGEPFHLGVRCWTPIPAGTRHTIMLHIAWQLSGSPAVPKDHFAVHMYEENERRCRPPLFRREMAVLIQSTVRKRLQQSRRFTAAGSRVRGASGNQLAPRGNVARDR